jgi:hypothetical protein
VNNLFTKIRDKHALWYKGIIFLFSVIFCVYLLPKKTTVETAKVQVGDVWLNEDLISPFDFLIKKTSSELALDQKEHKNNIPYYKKTKTNSDLIISELNIQSEKAKSNLKTFIDSVFSVGIYTPNSNISYEDSIIYIVDNNEVVLARKQNLFNENKLQKYLSAQSIDSKITNEIIK